MESSHYLSAVASHFEVSHAHRLRWAHAVNSWKRLNSALKTNVHFLEADVAPGEVVPDINVPNKLADEVCTSQGTHVIMAHYPPDTTSNLTFKAFIDTVIEHNEFVMQTKVPEKPYDDFSTVPFSFGQITVYPDRPQFGQQGDEAAIYATELDTELDARGGAPVVLCCGGARLTGGPPDSTLFTPKGIKLDFKHMDCVEPALAYLREINAVERLSGHLWLNADILAGPGAFLTPMSEEFVRLCANALPGSVLSLSWGSSLFSASRVFSEDTVEKMAELCLSPCVSGDRQDKQGVFTRTPAEACRHITFGVAVEYAQASATRLRGLLARVPGSSLTLFSQSVSLSITPAAVGQLITTYGKGSLFLDIKLTKSWRTCTDMTCCVQ